LSVDTARLKPTGRVPGEFVLLAPGDARVSASCGDVTGELAIHIDAASEATISGRVLTGPDGGGVSGATLTFGSSAPVEVGPDGAYRLTTSGTAIGRLLIVAPGFQTRETFVSPGTSRTVDFDLIGADLLGLYRRMARNGFEAPQLVSTAPTRRWTRNPNIYLWTTWQDTNAPVQNVEFVIGEIRRIIPQLSGGTLEAGVIETGSARREPAEGWINVQWDHAGNNAYVGANPGRVQFGADDTCNYQAITHEFGHAMGFWHTGIQPSVMGGGPGRCAPSDLTPAETRVARTMYARAAGNVEPDRDPAAAALSLVDRERDGALRTQPPAMAARCDAVLRRIDHR
jgi:hypothetical protein